jgi:hypothetical protein
MARNASGGFWALQPMLTDESDALDRLPIGSPWAVGTIRDKNFALCPRNSPKP